MVNGKIQTISILGPTASGKTSLALEVASRIGGEIVSCDSMLLYRDMNIGTAKPTCEEMRAEIKFRSFAEGPFCTMIRLLT